MIISVYKTLMEAIANTTLVLVHFGAPINLYQRHLYATLGLLIRTHKFTPP